MDLKPLYFFMYAKTDGICAETSKEIKAGDKILYLPPVKGLCSGRVFCEASKQYKEAEKHPEQSSYKF